MVSCCSCTVAALRSMVCARAWVSALWVLVTSSLCVASGTCTDHETESAAHDASMARGQEEQVDAGMLHSWADMSWSQSWYDV